MSGPADYIAGWIDTTIHDFLSGVEQPAAGMAYALITCLDSSFDVGSFWDRHADLSALKGKAEVVGEGLLLPTSHLLDIDSRTRLFRGFDEVWFFPRRGVTAKPDGLVLTGPDRIGADDIRLYRHWMGANNCSLGLGDGTGMNYWLRVRGAAKYVVAASNDSRLNAV